MLFHELFDTWSFFEAELHREDLHGYDVEEASLHVKPNEEVQHLISHIHGSLLLVRGLALGVLLLIASLVTLGLFICLFNFFFVDLDAFRKAIELVTQLFGQVFTFLTFLFDSRVIVLSDLLELWTVEDVFGKPLLLFESLLS